MINMHDYSLYNFLICISFALYSVMVLTSGQTGSRPFYYSDEVVEPEIPKDPLVEYFEKEISDLKEQLKRSEEEKMNLQFQLADTIDENEIKIETMYKTMRLDQETKMNAMRLKVKKIRKYAISQEAWYHYAVGSIITLFAIMIVFVVGFKFFK